jgi:hypothetical protein
VPAPKLEGDYNSDPDLVFHENQLWLFYRQTVKSTMPVKPTETNKVYLQKSLDGVRWSPPVEVLSDTTGRQLLSPAVIHNGRQFMMWTVEMDRGALKLIRRSCSDGVNWNAPETGKFIGLDPGRQPWHLDVLAESNRLSAVLVSCTGLGGSGTRIHYAYSEDDGLSWFANGFLLQQAYEFEANLQYRATLCKLDDRGSEYALWYSASSLTDVFSIAYVRMIRVGNILLPGEPRAKDKALIPA